MADSQAILQVIQEKNSALQSVCRLSNWRFALAEPGKRMEAEALEGWQKVNLSYSWSSASGDAWFGRVIQLPADIHGLKTEGHQ